MLWNLTCAPGLDPTRPATTPAARPIAPTLRAILDGWRDGLAAHRQYEQLRSRGIPHDTAVREALGIGHTPAQAWREAAKPLCFAGQA